MKICTWANEFRKHSNIKIIKAYWGLVLHIDRYYCCMVDRLFYCICSFGYFPGVRLCFTDVSEPSARSIVCLFFLFCRTTVWNVGQSYAFCNSIFVYTSLRKLMWHGRAECLSRQPYMQSCRENSSFVFELVGVCRTSENGDDLMSVE
jgi:hypothetical protein